MQRHDEPIGTPGVESALGRDRTRTGELPREMGTEHVSSGGTSGQGGAGDAAKDAARQAQHKAGEAMAPAQQKAGEVAGQMQQKAAAQAETQKERAAERLGGVAQALRTTGGQLRQEQQEPFARYADKAADQADRVAGYLRAHDTGQLVDDVEQFARRKPALFLGAAFALGAFGVRFLKSSTPQSGNSANPPGQWPQAQSGNSANPPGQWPQA